MKSIQAKFLSFSMYNDYERKKAMLTTGSQVVMRSFTLQAEGK